MTDDDRALLAGIVGTPDDVERVRRINDYWRDADRADRTPRELAYYHLGLLGGTVERLVARPAVASVRCPLCAWSARNATELDTVEQIERYLGIAFADHLRRVHAR